MYDNNPLLGVVDAAYMVSHFAKHNEYPKEGSPEFFDFTNRIDKLEVELKKVGFPVVK